MKLPHSSRIRVDVRRLLCSLGQAEGPVTYEPAEGTAYYVERTGSGEHTGAGERINWRRYVPPLERNAYIYSDADFASSRALHRALQMKFLSVRPNHAARIPGESSVWNGKRSGARLTVRLTELGRATAAALVLKNKDSD